MFFHPANIAGNKSLSKFVAVKHCREAFFVFIDKKFEIIYNADVVRLWRNWYTRKTKDLVSPARAGSSPVNRIARFSTRLLLWLYAQIAQSVEQRTENPRVGGSIPSLGILRV